MVQYPDEPRRQTSGIPHQNATFLSGVQTDAHAHTAAGSGEHVADTRATCAHGQVGSSPR